MERVTYKQMKELQDKQGLTIERQPTVVNVSHSKVVGQVMETMEYDLFNFIVGNREIRVNKALENSIKEYGILQPIKVNKDFNIIEGQHRYMSAKKNGVPIKYIVTDDQAAYRINEISELNSTSRKWNVKDYIHSFAAQGNEDYIKLNSLVEETKDINAPIFTLASMAVGYRSRSKRGDSGMISNGSFSFYNYEGLLVFIEDYRKFLRRTGIITGRDMLAAFFYLHTLKKFDLERLITKVNITNKAERLVGVRQPMVIVEILVDAYNHRLSTDSENFIRYTISTEPKTKGEIQLTGEVSNTLVKPLD